MRKILVLCSLFLSFAPQAGVGQEDKPTFRVITKTFTESRLLGEIISQAIEMDGLAIVKRNFGLGGTGFAHGALQSGEADILPDYTGTIAHLLLKKPSLTNLKKMRVALRKKGLTLSDSLGFNNTYALAVRTETARQLKIHQISDLLDHPQLKTAVSYEFLNREDGFKAMAKAYDLKFTTVRGIEHSLAYEALAQKEIDLTDVYTTDGKISKFDMQILEDDQGFFPEYLAVLLIRSELTQKYPKIWASLRQRLEGKLNEQTMIALNARAEAGEKFSSIAQSFLTQQPTQALSQSSLSWSRLLRLTWEHLYLVVVSLAAATLVGVPLGVVAYLFPRFGQIVLALTGIFQTVPSLALLCFFIPLFGIGTFPSLIALFLYGLLPIVRNTYSGLLGLDPKLREMALILGLSTSQRLRLVELPLASITIMAGVKTSAVINVGTATLAAFIGAGGYGTLIVTGLALNNMNIILQGAVPSALLALGVQGLFELLDRFVIPEGIR